MSFNNIVLIAIIGILVVFIALTILVLAFKFFGNLSTRAYLLRRKIEAAQDKLNIEAKESITGQEVAAIAMAMHLFMSQQHDEESNIITIKRIERRYSPWNSKIYGLTNLLR